MKNTIKKELAKLSLCYPMAKRTADEIELLTDIWFEDLENISVNVFLEAVKLHRQRSEYFPTQAEILKISNEINNMPKEYKRIEQDTGEKISLAEFKKNNPKASEILRKMSKKFDMNSVDGVVVNKVERIRYLKKQAEKIIQDDKCRR